MSSWFETILEDFNDLPELTANLLKNIREADKEVREQFVRIQREEEELLESLKTSIKDGVLIDSEAAEELKSRAAALSAQRQALISSMDKVQMTSARSLYEAVDDRINMLDANLSAVEGDGEGGIGDDQLASIESKNAMLKAKASSEGGGRGGAIALHSSGRGGRGGGRGGGSAGGGSGGSAGATGAAMTKKRKNQAASNARMKLQLKAVVGGAAVGQQGALGGGGETLVPGLLADDESSEPVYCTCRRVSFGQMVACENPDCAVEWFHFACVGLVDEPPDPWFCSECSEKLSTKDRDVIVQQAAERGDS